MNQKGKFISLEGIEGVGKSTIMQYIADYLNSIKIPFVQTREPGGTPVAESIRETFLKQYEEKMCPETELLLMFAGRMENITHIIVPALDAGKWVITDRYTDASFAYQGGGRGIPQEFIDILANKIQKNVLPDLTFLLDCPVEIALSRLQNRKTQDRIEREGIAFFQRVRQCYLDRAARFPQRFCVIQADQPLDEVIKAVEQYLQLFVKTYL